MPEFWQIAAGLGVPGFSLGILYMLYRHLPFSLPRVPRRWVGWLALAWMILGFAAVLFALDRYGPRPQAYRLRVTVLGPNGLPVEDDAKVWSSAGGESKKTSGGWEIVIPSGDRPADGDVTVYASLESAFLHGKASVVLAEDYVVAVEVTLAEDTSATIRGRVVDEAGNPAEGAAVSVAGYEDERRLTSPNGAFELRAHAAVGRQVRLQVTKEGFEPTAVWHPAGKHPAEIVLEKR